MIKPLVFKVTESKYSKVIAGVGVVMALLLIGGGVVAILRNPSPPPIEKTITQDPEVARETISQDHAAPSPTTETSSVSGIPNATILNHQVTQEPSSIPSPEVSSGPVAQGSTNPSKVNPAPSPSSSTQGIKYSPTPTAIATPTPSPRATPSSSPSPTPNSTNTSLAEPAPTAPTKTGALPPTQEAWALYQLEVKQAAELKAKVPLETSSFTITYETKTGSFKVVLKTPFATAHQEFIKWKTANYPAIPDSRFKVVLQ